MRPLPVGDGEPERSSGGDASKDVGKDSSQHIFDTADQSDSRPDGFDADTIDYDAAFAALIAQFDLPESPNLGQLDSLDPAGRLTAEPGTADLPIEPGANRVDTASGSSAAAGQRSGTTRNPADLRDDVQDEGWYPAVLDEHFEPEDPGPILRGDMIGRFAWAGLLGGPFSLIVAAVLGGDPSGWIVLAAVAAFVGGFATLIARMPAERDDDDDDNAVV